MSLTPPLKWHGGKHDLAEWIVGLMPPRCRTPNKPDPADPGWLHYVEPYFGGGAVMLALDPEGVSEVANDLNERLVGFWHTLQHPAMFEEFRRLCEATPMSQPDWETVHLENQIGYVPPTGKVRAAHDFFIHCRQSLSGRMKGFAGITRSRTRRNMNEQVSAWWNAVDGLADVHARLSRVLILNRPAVEVIKREDGPRTLFYLDPPYLHETRKTTGEYAHEMTAEQHRELLDVLSGIKGRFLLSGYHSPLYDKHKATYGWTCHEKKINNHASGAKTKPVMTECVWTNF